MVDIKFNGDILIPLELVLSLVLALLGTVLCAEN